MIAYIQGRIEKKAPTSVVLDVGGIGYELFIPLSSYERLPAPDATCRLLTYEHLREDAHVLYGFFTAAERDLFSRLLAVSGIGPKIALSALSGLSVREFKAAVIQGDAKRLSSLPGIGRKMAERMIVELRDKIDEAEALETLSGAEEQEDTRIRDAMLALVALGYKQADARRMIARVPLDDQAAVEDVVRRALTG